MRERDGAYHQGTAWGWLLGPFVLAHFRVYRDPEGVGSIAEIFDGDPPFTSRGCIAQAWSVSETLRAWLEIAGPHPARRAGRFRGTAGRAAR